MSTNIDYRFNYGVCRISRLLNERPVNAIPEAGFHTLEAAKKYGLSINDGLNYTYVFLNDKPVLLIGLDGNITEYFN